jgi:hypothetical protein
MRCLNHCIRRIKVWPHTSSVNAHHAQTPQGSPAAHTANMPKRTYTRPKIRRRLHLDLQIPIHLADDLDGVADSKMRVLPHTQRR